MVELILEPGKCQHCGQDVPAPVDGQWRYARGGKVHESLEHAEMRCAQLRRQGRKLEYRAVLDEHGRPRIATRRTA